MKKYNVAILFLFTLISACPLLAQIKKPGIQLAQTGFYPHAPKIAVVTANTPANDFFILDKISKDTVFKGLLGNKKQSLFSSTKTRIADFSALQKKGTYVVLVPGAGSSYAFQIKSDVHRPAAIAVLKGFYYQRVSEPLPEIYAGKWHRPAGHPDTEVLIHPSAASKQRPAGTKISSPGGWYDAGDYNKYIVNSGITMGTLLSAYEDFPAYFNQLKTNIPESKNKIPDILDEIIYNLRWMLTMQDPNDGGVYHKCTNADFDGMVMPGVTKLPRYVVQKGTAATLDFAAVTSQASRILKKFNTELPGLSDSCLTAAEKAWKWALQNSALEYNQNLINSKYEPKITTGGYGDRSFKDEWFWAASELVVTSGKRAYFDTIASRLSDSLSLQSWSDVRMLGYFTLLRKRKSLPSYAKNTIDDLEQRLKRFADNLIANVPNSAFATVMGQSRRDFIWGSNAVAANQGIVLINAYLITKDKKYIDYALANLDYILGRNATGYSFITGIGQKSTMHPHHRPSVADGIGEPVPGLLAGGPNPGKQDNCQYESSEPELAYSDTDCSFASNEIAINWNAPIVYVANALEVLQKEIGYLCGK
jgi:endoglucanase